MRLLSLLASAIALIGAAAPALAAPPMLQEAWNSQSLLLGQGDFDDDGATELLAFSNSSGIVEIIDGSTGLSEGALNPPFTSPASFSSWVADLDGDGRDELIVQYSPPGSSPSTALYDWSPGTGYDEIFLHNDDFSTLEWAPLRGVQQDLIESDNNDLWIRNLIGVVVFRASSDIPGWTGNGFVESFQVLDIDADGLDEILVTQNLSGMRTVRMIHFSGTSAVGEPGGFRSDGFLGNAPNPAAGSTEISFDLPRSGRTRLQIFDAQGRMIRDLVDAVMPEGGHSIHWDGKDDGGRTMSSGAYFYRLTGPGAHGTRKMIRIR